MAFLSDILTSFLLGLATPLTAVCVLPLYPGFLAYLANQVKENASKKYYAFLGLIITLGIVLFMLILGLIFTTILQQSLTNVIGVVSPIAFGILAILSLLLIFNFEFSRLIPQAKIPQAKNPVLSSLIYGFFFGAIVVPCNPGFISAFLARSFLMTNFIESMLNFLFFGVGLGFPLLAFSLVSSSWSSKIISYLTRYKRIINVLAGLIMLMISIYYLFFVFKIIG